MSCEPFHQTPRLEVTRCIGDESNRAMSEASWPAFEVHFQDEGAYFLHQGNERRLIDANHAEVRVANRSLSYSRPRVHADRGTSIRLSPKLAALVGRRIAEHPALEPAQVRAISWTTFRRWRSLRRLMADGVGRTRHADVEEQLLTIVQSLTSACGRDANVMLSNSAQRKTTAERHLRTVERAKEYLVVHFSERPSLGDVAADVGYAPHHLARVFRAITGLSLHRYLVELRLRQSAARLDDGADNLSRLAIELGFSSHSHFTTVFGTWFGCTPEEYREPRPRTVSSRPFQILADNR